MCQSWGSYVLIWIFPDAVFTKSHAHLVWCVMIMTEVRSHHGVTQGHVTIHPPIYIQSELNITKGLHACGFNHAIDMTVKYSSVRGGCHKT